MDWARVLWLALPVILGGAAHIVVIRLDVGPGLARLPIDGGVTYRGRRLLGQNKTWRGVVVMVVATTFFVEVQAGLWQGYAWARELSLLDFDKIHPLLWGMLLGGGYVAGEFPNSFLKRQLDVPPGERARGWLGPVFWVVDQLDSWFGVVAAMSIVWVPPLEVMVRLAVLTLAVHPTMALVMVTLGLKRHIG